MNTLVNGYIDDVLALLGKGVSALRADPSLIGWVALAMLVYLVVRMVRIELTKGPR